MIHDREHQPSLKADHFRARINSGLMVGQNHHQLLHVQIRQSIITVHELSPFFHRRWTSEKGDILCQLFGKVVSTSRRLFSKEEQFSEDAKKKSHPNSQKGFPVTFCHRSTAGDSWKEPWEVAGRNRHPCPPFCHREKFLTDLGICSSFVLFAFKKPMKKVDMRI